VLETEGKDDTTLREIQKILYSTEVCSFCVYPVRVLTACTGGV